MKLLARVLAIYLSVSVVWSLASPLYARLSVGATELVFARFDPTARIARVVYEDRVLRATPAYGAAAVSRLEMSLDLVYLNVTIFCSLALAFAGRLSKSVLLRIAVGLLALSAWHLLTTVLCVDGLANSALGTTAAEANSWRAHLGGAALNLTLAYPILHQALAVLLWIALFARELTSTPDDAHREAPSVRPDSNALIRSLTMKRSSA